MNAKSLSPIKIAVFTGTRAEYGILSGLLAHLKADDEFTLQLIVSGSHLSPEFGLTYSAIEADGFSIAEKLETLMSSNSAVGVAKAMALTVLSMSDCLARLKPDVIVLLGDRTELLAAAQTAFVMRIPILHLHGGEITEGALDDSIRHAITKLSHIHCVAAEPYRQRVIQLGEQPNTVFNVGALGVDNIKHLPEVTHQELDSMFEFKLTKHYCLVTYHSVTAGNESAIDTIKAILDECLAQTDLQIVVSYPNADEGGRGVILTIEHYQQQFPERIFAVKSLGFTRYINTVRHAHFVIGNSSSGIIEVPSTGTPSINVGMRQKGRIAASSVIHCGVLSTEIAQAITLALTPDFANNAKVVLNPYGKGDTAKQIITILKQANFARIEKSFYDFPSADRESSCN